MQQQRIQRNAMQILKPCYQFIALQQKDNMTNVLQQRHIQGKVTIKIIPNQNKVTINTISQK